MTALLMLWLARSRSWMWVPAVMLSVPSAMLLDMLLKGVFQRHRPIFIEPLLTLQTYSFPKGRIAAATLLYGVLAAWVPTTLKRPWHAPVVLLTACRVALVTLSRVWPSC